MHIRGDERQGMTAKHLKGIRDYCLDYYRRRSSCSASTCIHNNGEGCIYRDIVNGDLPNTWSDKTIARYGTPDANCEEDNPQ